jgi:hypothetical protein
LDLHYLAVVAILAIFVAVTAVVFVFLQQRWSLKTDILPPFWAARPASWFAFAEGKFREKAIISQWRHLDLLLAAMSEKILDQVMDVVDNIPEDFPYATLKSLLLETLSDHEKSEILYKSAFGWPETVSDAGQHAGLLSCWHGTYNNIIINIVSNNAIL